MPQLNLLPPEYRRRRSERRLLGLLGVTGAAVLAFLVLLYVLQRGSVAREEQALRREQALRDRVRARVARVERFQQLQREVDQRRTTLATALGGDVAWSRFLNDLSLISPDNSWLVSAQLSGTPGQVVAGTRSQGSVTFQGFVFDFPGLAGWLSRIAQIRGLTFVYLTSGARQEVAGRPVVSFAANANVTPDLLSQRCQAGRPCP